jgi:hypothetical protein
LFQRAVAGQHQPVTDLSQRGGNSTLNPSSKTELSELKIPSISGHTDRRIFAINPVICIDKTQACSDTLPATVPASKE